MMEANHERRPHGPGGHGLGQRQPMPTEIQATYLGEGVYDLLSPPQFHEYLILGEDKALLIDSGMGLLSIREAVEKITNKPVLLINTHGHPDHAGGNAEFPPALMNPADFDVFERMATKEYRLKDVSRMPVSEAQRNSIQPTAAHPITVEDNAVLDLGGRSVTVLFTPGHTHGSLCVYDEKSGILFTGDNAMGRTTNLVEWNSSTVEEYAASLRRMIAQAPKKLAGGHMPNICDPAILGTLLQCAEALLAGAEGVSRPSRDGGECLVYEIGEIGIGYQKDHIHQS